MLDELLDLFDREGDDRDARRRAASRQGGVRGFLGRLFSAENGSQDSDHGYIRRERPSRSRDDNDDDDRDEPVGTSSRRRRDRRDDRDDDEGAAFDVFGD